MTDSSFFLSGLESIDLSHGSVYGQLESGVEGALVHPIKTGRVY